MPGELRRLCGGSPRVVATFPNQDVLLAREDARSGAGFSIGGSTAIRSPAFVLGRLDGFRVRTAVQPVPISNAEDTETTRTVVSRSI
jgi:hypothetical protein